ncbi:MAG: hypothetical protein GX904_02330 [Acholeplasmataceae bacterium]|nr:hypothetical protein [Acholeplasmataceae bacterium]
MIEYIIYDLKMYHKEVAKDNHDYQIPLATDAEAVEIDAIEFQANDQDIPVIEADETPAETVTTVIEEEESVPETMAEPEPVVEQVQEPEPEPEPKSEPEVVVEKPEVVVESEVEKKEEVDFSREERELLDEKINLIIKKYHKKRRVRRFWTAFWIIILVAVLGFVGYSYYYYTYVNPGVLPFGIPVFW